MLPTGTRVSLTLWPGKAYHLHLDWVETDKGWHCYTSVAGVNKFGRIDIFDQTNLYGVFSLISTMHDDCTEMDEKAAIKYKSELSDITRTS